MDEHSDSEDSLKLAEKSWNRAIDGAAKSGYREGIEEGSQAVLQKDFDQGYEDGFKAAFELGKYKGLAMIFAKDCKHPDDIATILEKTRRGECHICIMEKEEKTMDKSNSSSMDIIANHRQHVASQMKTLREYFEPFIKEWSIESKLVEN